MQIQPGIINFTEESEIKKRYKELESFNHTVLYLHRQCIELIEESDQIPKTDPFMDEVILNARQLFKSINKLHNHFYCG